MHHNFSTTIAVESTITAFEISVSHQYDEQPAGRLASATLVSSLLRSFCCPVSSLSPQTKCRKIPFLFKRKADRSTCSNILNGRNPFIIRQYGRDANSALRTDILQAIVSLRSYFLDINHLTDGKSISLVEGIVEVEVQWTLIERFSAEYIRAALLSIDILFFNLDWKWREILDAEIAIDPNRVPAANFEIESTKIRGLDLH